jgi:short-subunit dehydrogenase
VGQDWRGRRAVVTGAASGIGRAFAQILADRGAELVLCDVNDDALAEVADGLRRRGAPVHTAQVDVSDAAAFAVFAEQTFAAGPVHLLVNNAGVAVAGRMVDTSPADWRWVVDVNLLGVVHGCHAFLPGLLVQRDKAAIVNVSSASAFGGVPAMGAYAATKAAVLSLSETLRAELDPASVSVHCVCPGFVPTNLLPDARVAARSPEAARLMAESTLFQERGRRPEQVVEATLTAVAKGRFLVTLFAEGHAARWGRALPQWARNLVLRDVSRRMGRLTDGD